MLVPQRRVVLRHSAGTSKTASCATKTSFEINICTGKTCKRQGSNEVLKFAKDLAIDTVEVNSCGCLGGCGHGPNVVVYPGANFLSKVSKPQALADVLETFCEVTLPAGVMKATELRMEGNECARDGQLQDAIIKYTQGLEALAAAGCATGGHLLYSNRSMAHLSLGEGEAALADALAAVGEAPAAWHTAWVRLIDAYYYLGRFADAAAAMEQAVKADRGFQQTIEYKAIAQALQRKGVKVA